MKTKLILILLILSCYFLKQDIVAQDFNLANYISGSGNIRINETVKFEDGIVLFGDFLGTLNRPEVIVAEGRDVFLTKYNNDFNLVWMNHIGGTLIDLAKDMVVDSENNIYILGSFQGTCLFNGLNEITSDGSYDVFVAKFTSTGSFVWAKKVAYSSTAQYGTSIDFDGTNLIFSGNYEGSVNFGGTNYTSTYGMYFAKLNLNGDLIWAKNIPTTTSGSALQSASAFSDGYYFNGQFKGTATFDLGAFVSNDPNYADVFLYKTDYNGNGQWLRRTYGNEDAYTGTITQDNYGNVYYTGLYGGTNMEVDSTSSSKGNNPIVNMGDLDIYVLKYNKNGLLIWSKSFGKSGSDWARDIKFQNSALYLTGYFSDSIIFGADTLISSSIGDIDAFIGVFNTQGNTLRATKIDDTNDNKESGMTLSVDAQNNIYWGGTFKSDSVVVGDSTFINPNSGKQCVYFTKGITPLSATFSSVENSTCNQSDDGELTVTPYFGVAPYTYDWSHNGSLHDSTATGLAAGTYTVTVKDVLDSTAVVSYDLTEPDPIIFNPVITDVISCSYNGDGAINLNVAGGNGVYSYEWFESNGGFGSILKTEDQSSLLPGTYSVTVTDSESCTADTVMVITGPDPITFGSSVVINDSDTVPGHNGAINLTLTGGTGTPGIYAASWTGPSAYTASIQDISALKAGRYYVSVTDVNSCIFDSSFIIIDTDTLFAYISVKKDDCTGGAGDGTATVSFSTPNPTPVISYLWSTGGTGPAVTGLLPGIYYVTVTESDSSWTSVDSVIISDLAYTIAGNLSGTSSLNCKGDANGYIDLTITTPGQLPYTYNWSNSEITQDVTNLIAGTYHVTVTDNNACTMQISNYSIAEPDFNLTASASIVGEPKCNGDINGEIRVDAGGGNGVYSYAWNDPGSQSTQIADGLDAGLYTVTVTDFKGCTVTGNISLSQPDILSVSGSVGDLTCFNNNTGTIALTIGGGTPLYSYLWDTEDGGGLVVVNKNQSGLSSGNYQVTVTDGNLCEITDSFKVTEPTSISIVEISVIDVLCNGLTDGSIDITVSGGTVATVYTYNWATSDGFGSVPTDEDQTGLGAGTYNLTVTDDNLCTANTSISILEPTVIIIETENKINASGAGIADGAITVEASGGTGLLTYALIPGNTSNSTGLFNSLLPGDYTVEVIDVHLCGPITSGTLTVGSLISIRETDISDKIKVYPNPTSAVVYVEIDIENRGELNFEILNISGQVIFNKEFNNYHEIIKEDIDLGNFPKGVYFIKINNTEVNYIGKIIRQ